MSEEQGFKDSTNLTQWVVWLLYGYIALNAIALFTTMVEFQFLSQSSYSAVATIEDWNNVFSIINLIVHTVLGVMVLTWTYRANYNARQIGATEMVFTPGWSIGWYFIPIANFWKPYNAMIEIWKASSNPQSWQSQPTPVLLTWWWSLWIGSNLGLWIGSNVDSPVGVNLVDQGFFACGIVLSFILISIVKQIHKMQMSHLNGNSTNG